MTSTKPYLHRKVVLVVLVVISFSFGIMPLLQVQASTATRYVSTSGNDSGSCNNAVSPCRTIQYAMNKSVSGDSILVARGTYTYSAASDPCSFLLTRAVVCLLNKNLTIRGGYLPTDWSTANPTTNLTVIDGQNIRRGVAFIGFGLDGNPPPPYYLDMEGFTIQNGRAQGPTYTSPVDPSGNGGGMWVQNAAVTLINIVFKNNQAIGQNTSSGAGGAATGAGLRIENSTASSIIQHVIFDSNKSLAGTGPVRGGIAFGAMFVYGSTVSVEDATFTNNIAQAGNSTGNGKTSDGLMADALGGAIGLGNSSAVLNQITATNNQVIGGNAGINAGGGFGGAIYSEDATAQFILSDSIVAANLARAGDAQNGGVGVGGGILVINSHADIIVNRVQIITNTAAGGISTGGGGYAGSAVGGGLSLWVDKTGIAPKAFVTNIVVTDNLASGGSSGNTANGGGGGGISVQGLLANISHATISQNRLGPTLVAGQGLLVLAAPGAATATANVSYSIIADHSTGASGAAAVVVPAGNTLTFNHGLFSGNTKDTNANGSPMLVGSITGLATMVSVPSAGFVSPGSPNYIYHLRVDSAARDQATGSTVIDDIDGQSRPYHSVSDFGADEYWPFLLSVAPGESSLQLDWTAGVSGLAAIVSNYDIIVTCELGAQSPQQGSCGQPINAGVETSYILTGLSNSSQYSIIINAYNSSKNLIASSTNVAAIPIHLFQLYLPVIVK